MSIATQKHAYDITFVESFAPKMKEVLVDIAERTKYAQVGNYKMDGYFFLDELYITVCKLIPSERNNLSMNSLLEAFKYYPSCFIVKERKDLSSSLIGFKSLYRDIDPTLGDPDPNFKPLDFGDSDDESESEILWKTAKKQELERINQLQRKSVSYPIPSKPVYKNSSWEDTSRVLKRIFSLISDGWVTRASAITVGYEHKYLEQINFRRLLCKCQNQHETMTSWLDCAATDFCVTYFDAKNEKWLVRTDAQAVHDIEEFKRKNWHFVENEFSRVHMEALVCRMFSTKTSMTVSCLGMIFQDIYDEPIPFQDKFKPLSALLNKIDSDNIRVSVNRKKIVNVTCVPPTSNEFREMTAVKAETLDRLAKQELRPEPKKELDMKAIEEEFHSYTVDFIKSMPDGIAKRLCLPQPSWNDDLGPSEWGKEYENSANVTDETIPLRSDAKESSRPRYFELDQSPDPETRSSTKNDQFPKYSAPVHEEQFEIIPYVLPKKDRYQFDNDPALDPRKYLRKPGYSGFGKTNTLASKRPVAIEGKSHSPEKRRKFSSSDAVLPSSGFEPDYPSKSVVSSRNTIDESQSKVSLTCSPVKSIGKSEADALDAPQNSFLLFTLGAVVLQKQKSLQTFGPYIPRALAIAGYFSKQFRHVYTVNIGSTNTFGLNDSIGHSWAEANDNFAFSESYSTYFDIY